MDRPPMICRVLDSNKYNYFKKIALEVFWVVHLDVGSLISMQGNFLSHTRSLSHALPLYFCEFVNLFNYFVLTSTLKIKIIKKKNIQTENLNFISSTNEWKFELGEIVNCDGVCNVMACGHGLLVCHVVSTYYSSILFVSSIQLNTFSSMRPMH